MVFPRVDSPVNRSDDLSFRYKIVCIQPALFTFGQLPKLRRVYAVLYHGDLFFRYLQFTNHELLCIPGNSNRGVSCRVQHAMHKIGLHRHGVARIDIRLFRTCHSDSKCIVSAVTVNDIKCVLRKDFPDRGRILRCLKRVVIAELREKKLILRNNACHHPPRRICGQKGYIYAFFYKFFRQRGNMRGFSSRPHLCGDE